MRKSSRDIASTHDYPMNAFLNVSLLGVFASVWEDYEKAITLVSECRVDLNPLVTHKFSVTQAGAAFEAAKSREGCKVQLAM